jgi:hypothetical protein
MQARCTLLATAVGALLLLDHVEEVAARGSPWPASASSAAAAVLARMTSDEKFALLYGHGDGPYDGTIPAMPNVGIPALRLQVCPSLLALCACTCVTTGWPALKIHRKAVACQAHALSY